jgi:hypothetical protein
MTLPLVIEKLTIIAPLGLCFHDAATGERVNDGLRIGVYPATKKVLKNKTFAFPNRVGVYVLQKAYGLSDLQNGAGDAKFWQENPPEKLYVVEVSDAEKRFQPFQFTLKLPIKGIYQWENTPSVSPNKNMASIPLYSAPTRKVLGGMSVIRAELRQADEKPASFAILEARLSGKLIARGIADRDGQIVLIFPSPSPQNNPLVSPPSTATSISLAEQKWLLDLTVKYEPAVFNSSPSISSENGEDVLPDLRLALAQATGTLWADAEQTEEYKRATLELGKELILRSRAMKISPPMPVQTVEYSSFLVVKPAI